MSGVENSALPGAGLPDHLKQFVVDQQYDRYTPIDHAVWRFIMRQNVRYLKTHAHRVYFQGLLDTGIGVERIPSIEEMNAILGKIGWGAVAVDGFIPPAAFMEFQAYRVLVIACDIRQIDHIEYTPAPDIVHEAAGHAPIIVDSEYAEYLRRFGEVGAKAMSSKKDIELYEAIRRLSILKEYAASDPEEIEQAERDVLHCQETLGEPSEMALLSRLHWWTVEYGLIGTLEEPKIYGAGLLSSIGESVSCLTDEVKKIPYSLETKDSAFDITTKQPQLFVTPSFEHLSNVLEEFVGTMAFTVGGCSGLEKAIECANVSTAVYSSGLQVTGVVVEMTTLDGEQPYYLKLSGPTALAYDNVQLDGHDKKYHKDGFGSPVGRLKGEDRPLEDLEEGDLRSAGIETGRTCRLEFESGVIVSGLLESQLRCDGKLCLLTFSDCRVKRGDDLLFSPDWGAYDMAVGSSITSVFSGAADKNAYDQISLVPKQRTIKAASDESTLRLQKLYQGVRDVRESDKGYERLPGLWAAVREGFGEDWLLPMEIFELLVEKKTDPGLQREINDYLRAMSWSNPDLASVITQGFSLAGGDVCEEQVAE